MSEQPYQPAHIETPPLFVWPLRPVKILRYLTIDIMVPWGLLWIAVASLLWFFLTPDKSTMQSFSFSWVAFLWLRNALVLALVAGGLHWWLYIKKSQNTDTKFSKRWLAEDNKRFLWGNQVLDNEHVEKVP